MIAATDDSSNTQNEEEKQKKMLLEKAHKEYKGAIFSEGKKLSADIFYILPLP